MAADKEAAEKKPEEKRPVGGKEDGKEDDDKPIKTLTEEDVRIMQAYGAGPYSRKIKGLEAEVSGGGSPTGSRRPAADRRPALTRPRRPPRRSRSWPRRSTT
jgi:DNA invertase Pin-like site-specific DNA recombinase